MKIIKVRSNKGAQKLWSFNDTFYGLVQSGNCSEHHGQRGWDHHFGTSASEAEIYYDGIKKSGYGNQYTRVSCIGFLDFYNEVWQSEEPVYDLKSRYGISLTSSNKPVLYIVDNDFFLMVHNRPEEEVEWVYPMLNIGYAIDELVDWGYIPGALKDKLISKFRKMFKFGYLNKRKRKIKKRRYQ